MSYLCRKLQRGWCHFCNSLIHPHVGKKQVELRGIRSQPFWLQLVDCRQPPHIQVVHSLCLPSAKTQTFLTSPRCCLRFQSSCHAFMCDRFFCEFISARASMFSFIAETPFYVLYLPLCLPSINLTWFIHMVGWPLLESTNFALGILFGEHTICSRNAVWRVQISNLESQFAPWQHAICTVNPRWISVCRAQTLRRESRLASTAHLLSALNTCNFQKSVALNLFYLAVSGARASPAHSIHSFLLKSCRVQKVAGFNWLEEHR